MASLTLDGMDNEQLKLTDFFDPLVMLALCLSFFADVFFILIPIRYIFAVIVAMILWPRMSGFVTKLIFIIAAVAPLPFLTIASALSVILSNALIRTIAVQVGIQAVAVMTAGVGEALEVGAVAGEAAAVGAEAVGAAAVAEAGASVATAGAEAAGAATEVGAGAAREAAAAVPKPTGPAARPPEMKGPQAQLEEAKKPSLRERVEAKAKEKVKEKLSEKLAEEGGPEEEKEEEPNVIEGEFGNPDIGNIAEEDAGDEGTVDLRNAA